MAKAIKITQEIKDKNAKYGLSFINKPIGDIVKTGIPRQFYVTEPCSGGYNTRTDLHEADGWQDVIIPAYNSETEKLGSDVIEVSGVFTYDVLDLTDEEIQSRIAATSDSNKEAKIQDQMQAEATAQLTSSEDVAEQLENIDVYDWWSGDSVELEVGEKVKYIDNLELKLYRVEQAHTTQENWTPPTVPALFTRVAEEGEILVWVAPTGAQDAYMIDDKVHFPTLADPVYISIADNNVWAPNVYGWELFNE